MKIKFNFRAQLAADWENLVALGKKLPGGRRRFATAPDKNPVFAGFSHEPEIYSQVAQPLLKGGQE